MFTQYLLEIKLKSDWEKLKEISWLVEERKYKAYLYTQKDIGYIIEIIHNKKQHDRAWAVARSGNASTLSALA